MTRRFTPARTAPGLLVVASLLGCRSSGPPTTPPTAGPAEAAASAASAPEAAAPTTESRPAASEPAAPGESGKLQVFKAPPSGSREPVSFEPISIMKRRLIFRVADRTYLTERLPELADAGPGRWAATFERLSRDLQVFRRPDGGLGARLSDRDIEVTPLAGDDPE